LINTLQKLIMIIEICPIKRKKRYKMKTMLIWHDNGIKNLDESHFGYTEYNYEKEKDAEIIIKNYLEKGIRISKIIGFQNLNSV
jgi:hypothetical protein